MARKKEEKGESKGPLQDTLDKLNAKYGKGTVLTLEDNFVEDYDVISTGSIGFDYLTLGVGGFVKGKLYELMGWEGCLAEDTFIKFITVRPDGVVQDCKGGTIKNLYERFYNRNFKTNETEFNVTSINEENKVFRNEILDVVQSGIKECFELTTKQGFKIKTSKDHKFFIGNNYVPLSDLNAGDIVYIHNNTPFKASIKSPIKKYKETTLKFYYKGKPKLINGNWYFRERVHRLIFEANQNELSYEEYKKILNSGIIPKDFWTIPEGYDIHHIDENTLNNSITNLQLIKNINHSKLHATERHNNLRFIVEPDKIVSIISIGKIMTYDIKCYFPYNNFIAEGIVVHNSGKSTICGHAVAECQKNGGNALYIDGEHAFDKNYFQTLGVDCSKLYISQPSYGEEGFQVAMDMINTGKFDLVIIDSDSSLLPKKVIDGEIGDSAIGRKALLNSNSYPKLKFALVKNNVCVLVVSQYREKIGLMFGNPTTTQGGHALKFYSDCRIEISRTLAKEGDDVYGATTKIKTVKNKTFPPYKKSEFEIVYGVGVDKVKELITLALEYKIIKKSGGWYIYGESSNIGQGEDGVRTILEDNPELYDEIRRKVINEITETKVTIEELSNEV